MQDKNNGKRKTQREKEQKVSWREQRKGQEDDPFTKQEFKFL